MNYFLMAISILFSVINACLLKSFSIKTRHAPFNAYAFNAGVSVVWIGVLILWTAISKDFEISRLSVVFGMIYGVILGVFLLFKMRATGSGPVSLTTLIGSCAFIIATAFSVVYAKEAITPAKIGGMSLLIFSLVLCINPKKSGEKLSKKWFFDSFMFFVAGGLVGILYKLFGKSSAAHEVNSMILIAAVISGIIFVASAVLTSLKNKALRTKPDKTVLKYMLLCGIAGCIYIRMNVSLSAVIPGTVFFPVSNGAMVILSTVFGKFFFKEKLKPVQYGGIFLGLVSIIICGISK